MRMGNFPNRSLAQRLSQVFAANDDSQDAAGQVGREVEPSGRKGTLIHTFWRLNVFASRQSVNRRRRWPGGTARTVPRAEAGPSGQRAARHSEKATVGPRSTPRLRSLLSRSMIASARTYPRQRFRAIDDPGWTRRLVHNPKIRLCKSLAAGSRPLQPLAVIYSTNAGLV